MIKNNTNTAVVFVNSTDYSKKNIHLNINFSYRSIFKIRELYIKKIHQTKDKSHQTKAHQEEQIWKTISCFHLNGTGTIQESC